MVAQRAFALIYVLDAFEKQPLCATFVAHMPSLSGIFHY